MSHSDELTEYISLFFSHYDFIMQLETKYVEPSAKGKRTFKTCRCISSTI